MKPEIRALSKLPHYQHDFNSGNLKDGSIRCFVLQKPLPDVPRVGDKVLLLEKHENIGCHAKVLEVDSRSFPNSFCVRVRPTKWYGDTIYS